LGAFSTGGELTSADARTWWLKSLELHPGLTTNANTKRKAASILLMLVIMYSSSDLKGLEKK